MKTEKYIEMLSKIGEIYVNDAMYASMYNYTSLTKLVILEKFTGLYLKQFFKAIASII